MTIGRPLTKKEQLKNAKRVVRAALAPTDLKFSIVQGVDEWIITYKSALCDHERRFASIEETVTYFIALADLLTITNTNKLY